MKSSKVFFLYMRVRYQLFMGSLTAQYLSTRSEAAARSNLELTLSNAGTQYSQVKNLWESRVKLKLKHGQEYTR